MAISWYPGHMHKAVKELTKLMQGIKVVIEVLDARTPQSSSNPMLASIIEERPRIKILNKADLADPETTELWQAHFNSFKDCICVINGTDNQLSPNSLVESAKRLIKATGTESKSNKQLVIVGIPNVGKSTLLNHFAGRKVARTGNEPAVTRGQQRVKLTEGWYLVDTPGLLWPRLEDQEAAYRLAVTGTIRNTAVEADDIAWFAAELLLEKYRERLVGRYEIDEQVFNAEDLFNFIASTRGTLTKKGRPDMNKTAVLLLNDFRSGRLGRFSLETPEQYDHQLIQQQSDIDSENEKGA